VEWVRAPAGGAARREILVKYVLLIMDTPNEPKPNTPEWGAWYGEVGAWYEKWGATGKLEAGKQLQGSETAKTVRSSGVTDGPYIETKEVLGGFSIIDADTIDEAVEISKTWPGVDRGWITVEVRPVLEMG
jgi:hypothetical protein